MGRWKRPKKPTSAYLNPDFDEIQAAITAETKGTPMIQLSRQLTDGPGTTPHYSGGWQGSAGVSHESHEHKGDKVIFESEGKQLFAGNGRGVNEYSGAWDLIIDLANNIWDQPKSAIKDKSSQRFRILDKHLAAPRQIKSELLSLDWPDGGIIGGNLDFWIGLWDLLPPKTVMMCIGGHGRTGTCMIALMIAAGEDYYDALDTVRKQHCDRAVETITQTRYLHSLYVERLKRNLAWATQHHEDTTDLDAELVFAQAHVPNSYSDYGEPEPPKSPAATRTVVGVADHLPADDDLKLVGDLLYERTCVVKGCQISKCTIAAHLGWVEFDIESLVQH